MLNQILSTVTYQKHVTDVPQPLSPVSVPFHPTTVGWILNKGIRRYKWKGKLVFINIWHVITIWKKEKAEKKIKHVR